MQLDLCFDSADEPQMTVVHASESSTDALRNTSFKHTVGMRNLKCKVCWHAASNIELEISTDFESRSEVRAIVKERAQR